MSLNPKADFHSLGGYRVLSSQFDILVQGLLIILKHGLPGGPKYGKRMYSLPIGFQ